MQEILALQRTLREATKWRAMSFMLAAVSLLLLVTIVIILPLKQTDVKYVEFSESGKVSFKVLPATLDKQQKVLLVRQMLREYVVKRITYTGNPQIDYPPIQQVIAMSSREVTNAFEEVYRRIHSESTIERREVSIISDIPLSKNVHQVQYKTIDYFQGSKYENQWTATINYKFEKQIVKEDNSFLNPLGIVVTDFIEAKKKLTEQDLNQIF